jgi:hypothetical protein
MTKPPNSLLEALSQQRQRLQFRGGSGEHQLWEAGATDGLPSGTRLILDFGSLHGGHVRWPPSADFTRLAPVLDCEWPSFADEQPYVTAVTCWALVERIGVLPFISSARGALQIIGQLYARYCRLPEAACDLLPAWCIEAASSYAPRANPSGRAYAPAYTPLGWLPRDPKLFGPRLVPMPRVLAAPNRRQVATDALFDQMTRASAVLLPSRGSADDQ